MQFDMDLQRQPRIKHQFTDALSRSHDDGATVDDSFPGDNTTKMTYRGPQGPVLDGISLGQLGIEGINNNNALPLTVLAAVTFIPDLPPVDINPVRHKSRAHSLDFAPILPKALISDARGGVAFGHLMTFFNSQVSRTTPGEHWSAPARTVWQPAQCSNELVQEI